MGTTPREPSTEAGKRFVRWRARQLRPDGPVEITDEQRADLIEDAVQGVLAIEAQAAAAERQRLADEVEGLPHGRVEVWTTDTDPHESHVSYSLDRDAVLRLLRADGGAA